MADNVVNFPAQSPEITGLTPAPDTQQEDTPVDNMKVKNNVRQYISASINDCVDNEYQLANVLFPMFVCKHQAYGIMREELEEAIDVVNATRDDLEAFWSMTKRDIFDWGVLEAMNHDIHHAIMELIQLNAMVIKTANSFKDEYAEYKERIAATQEREREIAYSTLKCDEEVAQGIPQTTDQADR